MSVLFKSSFQNIRGISTKKKDRIFIKCSLFKKFTDAVLLVRFVSFFNFVPVDYVKESLDIVRPFVLVF